MQKRLRVAVIGMGQWGRHHARIYAGFPDAELIAVVDRHSAEVRGFAHRYGTEALTDYRKLAGRVDAVSVVVPTVLHFEVARFFLAAGVHVLVEKPMTVTVAEAAELASLAERKNLVLLVGHVERFKPAVRRLFELVNEPVFIQARRVRPYDRTRIMDVGVIMDLMVHDLDVVLSLVGGRVVDVGGMGVHVHNSHEDLAVAQVRLSGGCVAWFLASRVSSDKVAEIEVTCRDRVVHLDYHRQQITVHPFGGQTERMLIRGEEPLRAELRHFLDCVHGTQRPLVTGGDGVRVLEVANQLLKELAVVTPPVRV